MTEPVPITVYEIAKAMKMDHRRVRNAAMVAGVPVYPLGFLTVDGAKEVQAELYRQIGSKQG